MEALNNSILEFSEHEKQKNVIFAFLHFSITYIIEKWRHIHVPQESLTKSEIPLSFQIRGLVCH